MEAETVRAAWWNPAMTTTFSNPRVAWQNRWSEPGLETLLSALKAHHRRAFNHLMQQLDTMDGVSRSLIWYGPGWKWTLQYVHSTGTKPVARKNGADNGQAPGSAELSQALCYLVPDSLMPLVCVPLSAAVIEQLPLKRLSKYVRDGILLAKCAVAIRWAVWSPVSDSEAGLLTDLIKRKHAICGGVPARTGSRSTTAGSNGTASATAAAPPAKSRGSAAPSGNGHAGPKVATQARPAKKSA
jgi:hypothetical protein